MAKSFRIIIAIVLVSGIVFLARNNVAWAGRSTDIEQSSPGEIQQSVLSDKPDPGSVKPPPAELTVCEDGDYSVGGVPTLEVNNLAEGYCLAAFLRNHAFALGRIPDGAGEVLAHITFLRVFHYGRLVHDLPVEDGRVKVCYSVPPDKQAQIYFFDFYGPRLGERTGQPTWEPLETTLEDGFACAPAQTTGAYALIGK